MEESSSRISPSFSPITPKENNSLGDLKNASAVRFSFSSLQFFFRSLLFFALICLFAVIHASETLLLQATVGQVSELPISTVRQIFAAERWMVT